MPPTGGSLDGRFIAGGIGVEIKGAQAASDKMDQLVRDLRGPGLLRATRDATLLVLRDARINAPVDTGRLRASIAPEVRRLRNEVRGVVGSNVLYAPYVEFGTKPHWPPKGALATWARRHGMPEGAVQFSIAMFGTSKRAYQRFGTKGFRYLQRALEDNQDKIRRIFERAAGRIVNK